MSCELVATMSHVEFEQARARLKQIILNLRESAREAAEILSRMSRVQLNEIKKDFKGVWSADHIDRLVLYGRGRISAHLAMSQKTLPANILRRLPKETLEVLNNPESDVEVWCTQDGVQTVKSRQVKALSSITLYQLLDKKGNILSASEQQKRSFLQKPVKLDENDTDIETPINLVLKGQYLFLKGKITTMRVHVKELRKFIP